MRDDRDSNDGLELRAADMLDRLQKEAAARVLAAYRFESNLVRGSVIEMSHATMSGVHVISVRFELNGEKFERTCEVDGLAMVASYDKGKAFGKLVDCVSEAVTEEVKRQALGRFGDSVIQHAPFKGKP
jgi:hypothetical protein